MDNKSIENCVCILRNLSYRCQEIVDPNYDSHPPAVGSPHHNSSLSPTSGSRAAAILGQVGSKVDSMSCFGGSKKKSKDATLPTSSQSADHLVLSTANMTLRTASSSATNHTSGGNNSASTLPRSKQLESIRGYELLWQPEIVQPYLALLSGCSSELSFFPEPSLTFLSQTRKLLKLLLEPFKTFQPVTGLPVSRYELLFVKRKAYLSWWSCCEWK